MTGNDTPPGRPIQPLRASEVAASVGVWPRPALLVDAAGTLLAWSPAALDLLGPGEAPASLSALVGDETAAGLTAEIEAGRSPEIRIGARVLLGHGTLLEDGLLLGLEDITEQHAERMHREHAERLASVGELLSSVAHELNNPLTTVLGYAEILLAEEDPNLPRDEIERIRSEATRCRRIVGNLLDISRAEAVSMAPLSIRQLLEKVVEFRGYATHVNQIALETRLPERSPVVMGDFHRLLQALLNLVTNAEYAVMDRASGRRVLLEASVEGDRARVVVEDNGPGVPADIRGAIFRPFFTSKPRGRGTGLGLSLARATAEMHSGTLGIEEGAEGGARFVLDLPLHTDPVDRAEPGAPTG